MIGKTDHGQFVIKQEFLVQIMFYMRKFEWVGHKTCKTRIPGTDNVLYEKV